MYCSAQLKIQLPSDKGINSHFGLTTIFIFIFGVLFTVLSATFKVQFTSDKGYNSNFGLWIFRPVKICQVIYLFEANMMEWLPVEDDIY